MQFYLPPIHFIQMWNEPYLHLLPATALHCPLTGTHYGRPIE